MASVAATALPRHTVAILGGGITGLSTAYYINRKFGPNVRLVILESTSRSGGWIQSIKHEDKVYELGPRSIRPVKMAGLNTLDLIQEIGLDKCVNYVQSDNPAVSNRLVYHNGELIRIPVELRIVFQKVPPLEEPLGKTFFKEFFKPNKIAEDDSLHSFVSRRLNPNIADTIIDPLVRGICAGDARKISVKFLAKDAYELEQKYGSVGAGTLLSKILRRKTPSPDLALPGFNQIGLTNIARTSQVDYWNIWTLQGGLEVLPQTLEQKLNEGGVEILKNAPVKSIIFDEALKKNKIEYIDPQTKNPSQLECSHVVSAIPATELAKILAQSKPNNSSIVDILNTIQSVNVTVTNFKFPDSFPLAAFGFLVPSTQKDLDGLLGAVFNTASFSQGDDCNIITTMSRGIDVNTIEKFLYSTIEYKNPSFVHTAELVNCIPQYTVGHYERVTKLRNIIKDFKIPLSLAGASYDGVSINDCILSGRRTSEQLPAAMSSTSTE